MMLTTFDHCSNCHTYFPVYPANTLWKSSFILSEKFVFSFKTSLKMRGTSKKDNLFVNKSKTS